MKYYLSLSAIGRGIYSCLLIGVVAGVMAPRVTAEEAKTNSVAIKEAQPSKTADTSPTASSPSPAKKSPPASARKLSGAELYSMHCNRCHPERYPTERTAAQWKTILLHMRVRANLPAEHARTILKYLQENSGR